MKIALLFSGQLRPLPHDLFKNSLQTLTKDLDCSIFSYCWREQGKSLNHQKKISKTNLILNINDHINYMFDGFNLVNYGFESFKEFDFFLSEKHKIIFNSNKYHFGTINSLPQIYTMHKCFQLLEKSNEKFDLIFRCRFDSIYIHPIKLFPLNKILNDNCLYNINFGRAYYPNRVYDIFFGGSRKSMNFLKTIWSDVPTLVNNQFSNGLDSRDSCRILFLAANLDNIKVKSFNSRICDVLRNSYYEYTKYLISSHLLKMNFNLRSLKTIKSISQWLKKNNLINIKILFVFFRAFIYMPISYIKRIKYFKN